MRAEYEKENRDVIMLLHGGGLAPWHYRETAELLKGRFHIATPILDGHNGSGRRFRSIEENAGALIRHIDAAFGGRVLFIGGLSLGGQILVEMLSQRNDICKFAMVESALALPMKAAAAAVGPTLALCYPLIRKPWFAKLQFQSLHIKSAFFEDYRRDSAAIGKGDMISFLRANSNYQIKNTLTGCKAKVLVTVGGRERGIMKKSAEIISRAIPGAALEILTGYYHGDLSINHPNEYAEKVLRLIETG